MKKIIVVGWAILLFGFAINAATITVTVPNGGETWVWGQAHNITWTTTGTIANVKIEYSPNNGTDWTQVTASTPNDGSYAWNVPYGYSTQCLVRVNDAANAAVFDVSNAVFNIYSDSTEPNNDSASAAVLPLGVTANLIYDGGDNQDVDWYKFFVPPADVGKDLKINVHVTSPYPDPVPYPEWASDLDFELLDGSLRVLGVAVTRSDNETLYLHDVTSGWYYIDIGFCSTEYADSSTYARYAVTLETGTGFGLGYVSGRVVNGSGEGVANEFLFLDPYPPSSDWSIPRPYMTTGPDGYFTIAFMPGTYTLLFINAGKALSANYTYVAPDNVLSEFYNNQKKIADADPITVLSGVTLNLGNVVLDTGAIVSGHVTNASAANLAGVAVRGYDSTGYRSSYEEYALTDASGNYTLKSVPIGGAKLRFNKSGYPVEFYNDKTSLALADILPTVSGETLTGIDAQLGSGGTISGRVTNAASNGIQGIRVFIYTLENSQLASNYTSASGDYFVQGLPTGSYKVMFYNQGLNYATEWYNNKGNFNIADQVPVTAGSTTPNINAQLAASGSISGRVTNTLAVGIQNIDVRVIDLDNNWLGSANTDASGNYTVSGLPAGNVKVEFWNNGQNYVREWYNDKASFATADQVTVTVGSTTPNINAQLASGGGISGRVTNASAVGIQNIGVWVNDLNNNYLSGANTDASGNYTVLGLPAGNLKVNFNNNGQYYASEWYNDKASFATADQVTVTAGSTTPNINAQLASGGGISGRVTNASVVGIQNIGVGVRDLADNNWIGWVNTDASGYYTVAGLPAGTCKVQFYNNGQNYLSEWYDDKASFATADQVTVTVGSTTPNINAQLAGTSDSISVISPNGGESWTVGTSHDITWSSTGTIANVNIDYSINSGTNWAPVAANTANDGTHAWTVPAAPSTTTTCLVRVSDAVDNDPADTSNAVFTITGASTGGSNIFLGYNAGYNETGLNKLYIDSSNTSAPLIYGDFAINKVGINGWLGVGTQAPAYPMELKTSGINAAFVANRGGGAINYINATDTFGNFGTVNSFPLRLVVNAAWRMRLNTDNSLTMANGASCSAGGVWTNASSIALKENITTLNSAEAASTLQSLHPVKYNYKAEKDKTYIGFIAEQVPELVAMKDRKGLSPMDIEAVLTRVVKDLQALTHKQQQTIENMIRKIRERKKIIADLLERVARIEQQK